MNPIAEQHSQASPEIMSKAKNIKLVVFDVDGVLTDGRLFFDLHGNEYKSFHVQDGHGIKLLQSTGVDVAIISGRDSPIVTARMASLGVKHIFQGQEDKTATFERLREALHLQPEDIAHVGDDLPDLSLFGRVGLAIGVADCNPALNPYLHWKTRAAGGHGAAREVCDLILDAQGHLQQIVDQHR